MFKKKDLNEVFIFNTSTKAKVSKNFIENSDDKKELISLVDIILPPNQIIYYNTDLIYNVCEKLHKYEFRLHFYQCDLAFEKHDYIVYDNIYEENMKIKIYLRNITNKEVIIPKNTVLGNLYFISKCRSFFEIYSLLEEENKYDIKYKYNDLLIKDMNNKIEGFTYTESIQDGNNLILKLRD